MGRLSVARRLGTALLLAAALSSASAFAQTGNAEEAARLFKQGSSLFLAKRYGEALEALRGSQQAAPSPNSGLLIARCLRELKRPVEAMEVYADVEAEARRRSGEKASYGVTADAAAAEGAQVKASLGTLRVKVTPPGGDVNVEVDGATRPLPASGELVIYHEPGQAAVRVRSRNGAEQAQTATVTAGSEARVGFELTAGRSAGAAPLPGAGTGDPAGPPPPPPPPDLEAAEEAGPPPRYPWATAAGGVSVGVGVVGLSLFAGFGLASSSTFSELEKECGPNRCGAAQRQRADEGKQQQTLANVGLVVTVLGAGAAVAFFVMAGMKAPPPRTATTAARLVPRADGFVLQF